MNSQPTPSRPRPPTLLPTEILLLILQSLHSPRDLAHCAQVNRHWWDLISIASQQSLWSRWCRVFWVPVCSSVTLNSSMIENWKERGKEMFQRPWDPTSGITATLSMTAISGGNTTHAGSHLGTALGNTSQQEPPQQPFMAFRDWSRTFHLFQSEYPRVKTIGYRIMNFLRKYSPPTLASLVPGHQQDWAKTWGELIRLIGLPSMADVEFWKQESCAPLREWLLFYHFYDGQKPRMPHVDVGLFGTYHCYGQFSSLLMLPYRHIQRVTFLEMDTVLIAVCPRSGKFLALVVQCPPHLQSHLLYHLIELDERNLLYKSRGTFLQWMEQYVDAMSAGLVDVSPERALSMFWNSGPNTSTCVTRGIRVTASAINSLESGSTPGVWVYRIKLQYEGGPDSYVQSQLFRRHWIIRYLSGAVEEVEGEAVIGEFPIMSEDHPTFTYCSLCTGKHLKQPMNRILNQRSLDRLLGVDGFKPANSQEEIPLLNDMLSVEESSDTDVQDKPGTNWSGRHYLGTLFDPALTMEGWLEFVPGRVDAPLDNTERFRVRVKRFVLPQPSPLGPGRLKMESPEFDGNPDDLEMDGDEEFLEENMEGDEGNGEMEMADAAPVGDDMQE